MSLLGGIGKIFGGGGIFGALLNVASMMFPPLQMLNSLSNLLTSAIGGAVKQAADTLMKEFGMPKFIRDSVNSLVDSVLPGQMKESSAECDHAVQSQAGEFITQFRNDFYNDIIKHFKEKLGDRDDGKGNKVGAGGGKAGAAAMSGKSWYVQLAIAMGEALNKQADKVEKLAGEVNKSFDSMAGAQDKVDSKTGKGMGDVTRAQGKNFQLMQELQAEAKVLDMLSQTVNNAVNAIGQALGSAARK